VSEDREVGSIGYGVYVAYGRMYGLLFVQMLMVLWASEQTTRVLTNWWLSRWTGAQAAYDYLHGLGALRRSVVLHCTALCGPHCMGW
jgi:hypothetical protein